jgi:AraC-like DNA-binding protein
MLDSDIALYLSISQAVFLAIGSLLFLRNSYIGKLLIAFALSMLGYLFYHLLGLQIGTLEGFILGRISYAIPGIIWLMAYALFEGGKPIPLFVWVFIAAYILLRAIGVWINPQAASNLMLYGLFFIVPQIINIGMYIHTLGLAFLEYKHDLVELRRNLRVAFVLVLGTFWLLVSVQIFIGVLGRMGVDSAQGIGALTQDVLNVIIFPVCVAVNLVFIRICTGSFDLASTFLFSGTSKALPSRTIDPRELELKDKLLRLMEVERLYCQPGLTIGDLAVSMRIQEYRLRSLINKVLMHNNFSHFLNKYRIRDAEQRLLKSNDSIFNIALDVGYTSLSSFHKAFREAHAVTPKEYRVMNRTTDINGEKKFQKALPA